MQELWNDEAKKHDAGEQPANDALAAAPLDDSPAAAQPDPQQLPEQIADPLAGLSDAVRAKLAQIDELANANAQLLQHVRSAEGRVAAMQREFQQAKQAATTVAPQDSPTQGQMVAAAKNPQKWDSLKEDFPEWALGMEEYVAAQLGGIKQSPGVQALEVADYVKQQMASERVEVTRMIEEARVEGRYENWRETINTPVFAQWFAVQSPETRTLADSVAGRDAIRLLDLFHKSSAKPATEIRQERGQRLAAAASTRPGQTPPPKTLDDMSPEEVWNYEAASREKTRLARGY